MQAYSECSLDQKKSTLRYSMLIIHNVFLYYYKFFRVLHTWHNVRKHYKMGCGFFTWIEFIDFGNLTIHEMQIFFSIILKISAHNFLRKRSFVPVVLAIAKDNLLFKNYWTSKFFAVLVIFINYLVNNVLKKN